MIQAYLFGSDEEKSETEVVFSYESCDLGHRYTLVKIYLRRFDLVLSL